MKKNFALTCIAFTAALLVSCNDTNISGANTAVDSYLSSASGDPALIDPAADPTQGNPAVDPTQGDPTIDPTQGNPAVDPTQVDPAVDPTQSDPTIGQTPTDPAVDPTPVDPAINSSNDIASSADVVPTSSSPTAPVSSSSEPVVESSSSEAPVLKIEGVYDYVKGNAPAPSKGCGKTSTLKAAGTVENGTKYNMTVAGLNREFFITLPKNYDNTKPHKLLFAMHCMGSNAEDFVHHSPDADHPSPYYGQQNLDKEGNYIFVAPRGDTDGSPWRVNDDKDHQFFDKLLTTMEDNYCIDTSRVFVTGFSFGSMVTNSLAQVFQHRVRAAVTYAVADWNIYIPTNAGKPIAWMDVHGSQDNLCSYSRLSSSITRILKNNGPGGTDVSSEINDWQKYSGSGHVCYDFKKVDPNHPVRVCTWGGGHQWTANDNGGWQNTWVPEDVHKFIEQF